jgi:predicted DsbA family dithiol-disulfide isomerase
LGIPAVRAASSSAFIDSRAAVAATLASDDYSADVDQSMATAQRLNISGVPFFIFNQRFAVSGAQPTEIMLKALDAASGAIDIQS